jgi:hypothetical protein
MGDPAIGGSVRAGGISRAWGATPLSGEVAATASSDPLIGSTGIKARESIDKNNRVAYYLVSDM